MFSGLRKKKSFYRAPGDKWAQATCAGCPQQRYIPGEPGNVHIMFHETSHIKLHEIDRY